MNHDDKKVLACVDLSPWAQPVADAAAWAAARLQAPMELLHVIDRHPPLAGGQDRSGAIGANAQQTLLQDLSDADAARTRAEREAARVFLQALRARAETAGAAPVDTRQRHGELADTLAEQQDGVRLFVLGRRGASAAPAAPAPQALGRQVEWTVRALRRPILVVQPVFAPPQRVLIAFDGSAVTRQGVDMVAASPLFRGLEVQLLMSGRPQPDAPQQLEGARRTLEAAGLAVQAGIEPGEPEAVLGRAVRERGIDLLVMGAYTHSPLRALLRGSTTTELLRAAPVNTLLLR